MWYPPSARNPHVEKIFIPEISWFDWQLISVIKQVAKPNSSPMMHAERLCHLPRSSPHMGSEAAIYAAGVYVGVVSYKFTAYQCNPHREDFLPVDSFNQTWGHGFYEKERKGGDE